MRDLLGHDGQISRDGGRKSVGGCVSFPKVEGGQEFFFGQNMRSGQKVGQQVLLWVACVGKSLGRKSRHKLCKKGTIGISSKVSLHTLIVGRSIPQIVRRWLDEA